MNLLPPNYSWVQLIKDGLQILGVWTAGRKPLLFLMAKTKLLLEGKAKLLEKLFSLIFFLIPLLILLILCIFIFFNVIFNHVAVNQPIKIIGSLCFGLMFVHTFGILILLIKSYWER